MDNISKENLQCHSEELEEKVLEGKGQSDELRFVSKELEETKAKLTALTLRVDQLEKEYVALVKEIQDRREENVGLLGLGELEKSRGQVKDLSEKLKLIWEEKIKELTVSKAELEDKLRVSNDLEVEPQLFNERLESEISELGSQLTGLEITGMDPEIVTEAREAMEGNDEASQATLEDIFGNPVIFNHILDQLPNSQLLQLSLVNKFWKKETRIVMKKRGNVMALLKSDRATGCAQVLEAFAANLETLNETLYSGMTIRLEDWIDECEGTGALEVERLHESILTGMRRKLKRLSIKLRPEFQLDKCWNNPQVCPISLLIRILLRDFIWDLEHLTLDIDGTMPTFIQDFLPHGLYPKLKVVKLSDEYVSSGEAFGSQVRLLLSRAPNLQELHTRGEVSLTENLMEGREGVVHVHESPVYNPMEDISENIIPALRLKQVEFYYITANLNLDRWNEKAQRLLRTCCSTTLEFLGLVDAAGILFMSYGIQLVNVNELEMELHFAKVEQFQPRILGVISRFDFTYLLPNLKKVSICMRLRADDGPMLYELPRDEMDAIIEQASAVPMEPTLPRAGNITFLKIHQRSFTASAVRFFAHMFPAIQELEIWGEDFPVELAWELWPELKLIKGNQRHQRP